VTEIPEHLLKRSKARRAAMGLPGGEGGETAEAGDAPAAVEQAVAATPAARAATPAPAAPPPPPPPLPPYVQAAQRRRRIPYWAMPIVALLPVWAFLYLGAVSPPPPSDDLAQGEELYSRCSSCHGASGAGGIGAQLNQGEVLKTFKDPKDLMMWLRLGAAGGARPDGSYGDPDRPGGAHNIKTLPAVMPAFDLSGDDLADVTRYVRETLSGEAEPDAAVDYPTLAEEAIAEADAGELPSSDVAGESGSANANSNADARQDAEGEGG